MGIVHAKEPYTSTKEPTSVKMSEKPLYSNDVPHVQKQAKVIDLQAVKTRVDKIHIDGLKRTKDDIVKAQVRDLFNAHDFQDVIIRAYKVRGRLEALGCFQNVGIYIDTSEGPGATSDGVEVTFTVNELNRIVGTVQTMVGNNETSFMIGANTPNMFGRGEKLQVEYSHGTKHSTNVNISAVKPFISDSWLHTVLTSSIFHTTGDFPWSGYKEGDTGLLLDFALTPEGASALKHNLQYEAVYRNITAAKQASFSVREQCGPSLKSSLRHIFSLDKRDGKVFPTKGSLIQFSTEFAGLGGDIGFVKNELSMQSNWTLFDYMTFQLGVQSGLLRGISNDMKINLADRFFLGGPLNFRGFSMRGCGPHSDGNAIGGDVYWATALHVYTPLPFKPGRNSFGDLFRLHGFINGGNLSNDTFKLGKSYKENMRIFTDNVRCSIGGGLAMRLGTDVRIELNFITPLLFSKNDILQQFQFGIGIQYL